MKLLLICTFLLGGLCLIASADPQLIQPGEIWLDDRGNHVEAHGGGIIKLGDTYYWFGEDRSPTLDPQKRYSSKDADRPQGLDRLKRYVSCYSSRDLAHWVFRNGVIQLSDPEHFGPKWVLERPKVFYNEKTRKYVMYMHIDGPLHGKGGYRLARVGIATCDTVDGDYHYLKSFQPLGNQSRDIGQFIDDDGSAYLISEDRLQGFHIYKLSDDYLSIDRDMHLFPKDQGGKLEGGALVHYHGLYYVVGSQMTGWRPNPNQYATAKSLEGPWSEFKDIAPPEKNTYGSQSTMLLNVVGTKTSTVIFMGDIWKPKTQCDSRYLWMPLEIGNGKFAVPDPKPWTLDVATGEAVIQK